MSLSRRRIDVLIVAEKPKVAYAFAKYLAESSIKSEKVYGVNVYLFAREGKVWASIGLSGHLMNYDFPQEYNRWKSINPRDLFKIDPIKVVRRECVKYVLALRELAKYSSLVILALDADAEGESITFEVMEVIRKANPYVTFRRAWFCAITKRDILNAIKNLTDPNPRLANKSFARMIVDLTIGAAFTRALTLAVERERRNIFPRGKFLSYGPCQSPVLYLVVKRAWEREEFRKKKYYVIEAYALINGVKIKLQYEKGRIDDRKEALQLFNKVKEVKVGAVEEYKVSEKLVKPPEPLNTIEMERKASLYLNIRPKDALDIAEELYRDGLISYPRTETTIYPPTLNLREIVYNLSKGIEYSGYISKYILSKPRLTPTRGSEDDKAHPPIHPLRYASREYLSRKLSSKAHKLYDYIVRHFLATLSDPARVENQKIAVSIGGLRFVAKGSKVLYEGFWRIYPYSKITSKPIPRTKRGEQIRILSVELVERETQPPPYLSEAELLRLMKKYGIGTDATMQDHIHTNVKRKYFIIKNKRCIPTPLGKAVIAALYQTVPEAVKPEVRGNMEKKLLEIAEGKRNLEDVVNEIKEVFLQYFDRFMSKEKEIVKNIVSALEEVYQRTGIKSKTSGAKPAKRRRTYKVRLKSAREYFKV